MNQSQTTDDIDFIYMFARRRCTFGIVFPKKNYKRLRLKFEYFSPKTANSLSRCIFCAGRRNKYYFLGWKMRRNLIMTFTYTLHESVRPYNE